MRRERSPADGEEVADRSSTSAGRSPARWWHRHAPGWREVAPGWQGRAAAALLVAVLGAVSVAAVLDGSAAGGTAPGAAPAEPARVLLSSLGPAVAAVLVARRARASAAEGPVWRWWAAACAVVAVAGPVEELAPALPAADAGGLVAALLLYQGTLHWNRFRGPATGPGDWLNGVGAVLCVAALGTLLLRWTGTGLPGSLVATQAWLLELGAALVLLGTLPTVASLAGLLADVRIWALTAATVGVVVALAARLADPVAGTASSRAAVVVLVVVVALVSITTMGEPHAPRPATASASTGGAVFVLLFALGLLVVSRGPVTVEALLPVAYGVLAVLGVAARAVHLVRDLSQLAVRRQEALTDDLTGAGNRRGLAAQLGAPDAGRGRALLLLDLDGFKEVNDLHGHATGDLLLQEVAVRLHGLLPADAYLARPGGDEFAVVLGPRSARSAPAVAAAVGRALERPVLLADRRLVVGGSVGVAVADDGSDLTGEELLRRADVAMYTAKAAGGGVSRYDRELDRAARDVAELLEDLRALLGPRGAGGRADVAEAGVGRLVVHHQVQLDAAGRVVGTEALVRWSHPRRGLVPPDAFLPLAEQHGLMSAVTRHVLRRALEDAAVWRREGRPLRTSVNLSTSCLSDPALPGAVAEVLASTGTPASALVLEVTETTLMADPDAAVAAARRLVALGAGVSIDDYGTGYSSLAYLQDLPVTELKLDRVFAARVADERTTAIVAGTVELAHRLGVRVVAEGVEDEDVLARLVALGCDETQGYLHGRPAPADEVLARAPDDPDLVRDVPARGLPAPRGPVPDPRTPGVERRRTSSPVVP